MTGDFLDAPLAQRLIESFLLFVCGLFCAFRDTDNDGNFLRAASVYGGFGLIGAGLLLWWITFAFPSTWDWPL